MRIRLERGDIAALERRADQLGTSPSHVARNLIRSGLYGGESHGVRGLAGELELLAARLRSAAG